MVADQAAPEPVIDQPGVAIRTGEPKSALAAKRERGVAAAIEEKEGLLAAFERVPHRLGEARRDEAPARRAFGAQIDRLDGRKTQAAEALRQMHSGVAATAGVDLGLDRRRRRHQHDRDIGSPRSHHGHVARVIARAVLLLVSGIVLLIDHDQPEIGIGQKQCRACADDHAQLAGRHRIPSARAQTLRQLRVPLGRPHAEALGKAVEELGGQGDLGDENQRLFSTADDLGDGLEIDLGLTRAGDAIEQRDAIAARGHRRA